MADHNENPGNEDTDVLDPSVIDRVPWDRPSQPVVRHSGEEFVTGCPFENDSNFPGLGVDVGEVEVVYRPGQYLLETNTFQEYLNQFKDARLGHEAIVDEIFMTTAEVLYPIATESLPEDEKLRLERSTHPEAKILRENIFVQVTYPVTTSGMRRDVAFGNEDLIDKVTEEK